MHLTKKWDEQIIVTLWWCRHLLMAQIHDESDKIWTTEHTGHIRLIRDLHIWRSCNLCCLDDSNQSKIEVKVVNQLSHHDALTRVSSESFTTPFAKGIVTSSSTVSLTFTAHPTMTLSSCATCASHLMRKIRIIKRLYVWEIVRLGKSSFIVNDLRGKGGSPGFKSWKMS